MTDRRIPTRIVETGRVVRGSDLLTVLPERFIQATGAGQDLVTRTLPMNLAPVTVEMLWHLRHDHEAPHRWLRERIVEAATG